MEYTVEELQIIWQALDSLEYKGIQNATAVVQLAQKTQAMAIELKAAQEEVEAENQLETNELEEN